MIFIDWLILQKIILGNDTITYLKEYAIETKIMSLPKDITIQEFIKNFMIYKVKAISLKATIYLD